MGPLLSQPAAFDFDDFFEDSLCGYVIADPAGRIIRANRRLALWMNCSTDELVGKRYSDLLTVGGKIYFETHLAPLLKMQGHFDEIALELRSVDGARLPVLANAMDRRDDKGEVIFTRWSIFKAADRRLYEENLRQAHADSQKALSTEKEIAAFREQFIAVLGHDLRSPLGGVVGALSVLDQIVNDPKAKALIALASNSADRMAGLISDVMDFARGRLGGGMIVDRKSVDVGPHLRTVVAEQQAANPSRLIYTAFENALVIRCDTRRLAQLLSNLLANAVTHGADTGPITVQAKTDAEAFELSVSNSGIPIPQHTLDHLFEPFKREEARPSQNGLGLGLYIAAEIARAHGGSLSVRSDDIETRFTFVMPAHRNASQVD